MAPGRRALRCAAAAVVGAAVAGTAAAEPLDVKVSKAMRERGYDWVRISVVSDGTDAAPAAPAGPFWDYDAQFQRKWTKYRLQSTLKPVTNGEATFDLGGGSSITVRLPREGALSRGFFIADPCISSRDMHCDFADLFKIFDRLVEVVNTLVASHEIDFWGILGDNFYEFRSPIGQMFFQRLSMEAKATPFFAVPGNHDFWITGGPTGQSIDQYGNGFMQYYGQDTLAALKGPAPYDFSADPNAHQVATFNNFFFHNQIGDIAFVGYSGAHKFQELQPYADEFCNWLQNATTVNTAIILGHWNEDNLGCTNGMSAPDVYKYLKDKPGCKDKHLLYIDGHAHCNQVTLEDHGFMIGANGMGGCSQFGFLVIESDPEHFQGPNVRADYFELANVTNHNLTDKYNAVFGCIQKDGYQGCRDLHAASWRSVPTAPPAPTPPAPGPAPGPAPLPADDDSNPMPWILAVVGGILAVAVAVGVAVVMKARKRRSEARDLSLALTESQARAPESQVRA